MSDQPHLTSNAMSRLDPVARRGKPPHCYLWISLWWNREGNWMKSRFGPQAGSQSRVYSKNQLRLFRDMVRNPEHYRRRPTGKTDWQWSGLKSGV